MGRTLSAEVYFGYDLGDMFDPDTFESTKPAWWQAAEDDDSSGGGRWQNELARQLGWVEPPFPDDVPEYDDDVDYAERQRIEDAHRRASPEYQAWEASLPRRAELLGAFPVEIACYGHSYEFVAVRVKASVQTTSSSSLLEPLDIDPAWLGQLTQFVELLSLRVSADGPAWHISCSYG